MSNSKHNKSLLGKEPSLYVPLLILLIYSTIVSKVLKFIQTGVTKMMKFLGATPEVRVNKNIKF